jgi:hypothetical protein
MNLMSEFSYIFWRVLCGSWVVGGWLLGLGLVSEEELQVLGGIGAGIRQFLFVAPCGGSDKGWDIALKFVR